MSRVSRLCLVDLAGSERADKTGATGLRLRESGNINKSLVALGCVINALAESSEQGGNRASPKVPPYVPYRDSQLTWLLSDSLGGNAKTIMIATISPSLIQFDETLSTLRYADRAKSIEVHAIVNEDPQGIMIRELKDEINNLKKQLAEKVQVSTPPPARQVKQVTVIDEETIMTLQKEVSTLKIQNFARATLLNRISVKKVSKESICEDRGIQPDEGVATPAVSAAEPATSKKEKETFFPYLVELSEDALPGEKGAAYITSELVNFDEKGYIVSSEEMSPTVAFAIELDEGKMYASVPPGRALMINGQKLFFSKGESPTKTEIYQGTRLALEPTRILLVLRDERPYKEDTTSPTLRQQQHEATWAILKPFPHLYWKAAQVEILRGFPLTASDITELVSGGETVSDPVTFTVRPPPPPARSQEATNPVFQAAKIQLAATIGQSGDAVPPMTQPAERFEIAGAGTSDRMRTSKRHIAEPRFAKPNQLTVANEVSLDVSKDNSVPGTSPVSQTHFSEVPKAVHRKLKSDNTESSKPAENHEEELDVPTMLLKVEEIRGKYLQVEKQVIGYALDHLRKDINMANLVSDLLGLVPDVIEATTIAESLNKPVAFYLDLTPRFTDKAISPVKKAKTFKPPSGRCTPIMEVFDPDLLGTGDDVAFPPPLLELATQEYKVTVRMTKKITSQGSRDLTVDQFKSTLKLMRRAYKEYKAPESAPSPAPRVKPLTSDPFFLESDEVKIGRTEVYLSALLEGKEVSGDFPVMSTLTGTCIGAVKVHLKPLDKQLPQTSKGSYDVRMTIESLVLAKKFLAPFYRASQKDNQRYSEEPAPTLVLRHSFFNEAEVGEVNIGRRGSTIKDSGHATQGERVLFPLAHTKVLKAESVDLCFLTFLAVNALRLEVVVTKDPIEKDLWIRNTTTSELWTNRNDAYRQLTILGSKATEEGLEERPLSVVTGNDDDFESVSVFTDTCSRYSRYTSRASVRRSKFYSAHNNSYFFFMTIDILEPELEPGVDYYTENHKKFKPVDLKHSLIPASHHSSTASRGRASDLDEFSVDRPGSEAVFSEISSLASHQGPMEAIFHVVANPRIRMRQLRIVVEQVDSYSLNLESVGRVFTNNYFKIYAGDNLEDIQEKNVCETELTVFSVTKNKSKRRIELYVEMPASHALYETCLKGERYLLTVEVEIYQEGVIEPYRLRKDILMKVLPPERKSGLLYNIKKNLKDKTKERSHVLGAYYSVKLNSEPCLRDSVSGFVNFRISCLENLLKRMDRVRETQLPEGAEGSKEGESKTEVATTSSLASIRDFDYWSNNLNSPRNLYCNDVAGMKTTNPFGMPEAPGPLAVDSKEEAMSVLFGVDIVKKKNVLSLQSDGVYRVMDDESTYTTYAYPEEVPAKRNWGVLQSPVVENVPEMMSQKEGFLNMRVGLLGSSWGRAWFLLRRPFLFSYRQRTDTKPLDVLYLTDCKLRKGTDDLDIVLAGPKRTWYLQGANDDDFVAWVTMLDPEYAKRNFAPFN